MTYKNLLDNLESIINAHYMVETYGYGNISDISVPDNEEPADYPYVFINPVDMTNGRNSFNFSFNMIVMTQVQDGEDNEIVGQDKCVQIIQDIVSAYINTNTDPLLDMETPFSITPFKERFSDDVVGATAALTINYAKAIDGCDTPFGAYVNVATASCPQATITDGDGTEYLVDAGGSFSCLPATPKAGIQYQRVIPWKGFDTSGVVGAVEWHRTQGTYDYTPPTNPVSATLKRNGYEGTDDRCLLAYENKFGNFYRYTNDIGQQYVENFNQSGANTSTNKQLCIDHLTGLAIYVENAYDESELLNWEDAIDWANGWVYAGFSDWRLADVGEFLALLDYNDWANPWPGMYTPWMDPDIRNYGGRFWFGCRNVDGLYMYTQTNGALVASTTNANLENQHRLMVRNYYI